MGCFMACFGLSNKRKRRKTLYKVLATQCQQKYGNYEVLGTTEKSIVPYSDLCLRKRVECKEQNGVKRKKKKVTFNLNVQIFELNPTAYEVLDNEEEEENENITAEQEERRSYPSDYRYYNCRDDFDDEEDEIPYEESDLDDYDDEFDDGGSDDERSENYEGEVFDKSTGQKELSESCYSSSVAEERVTNHIHSVLSPVENLTQWKAIKAKVVTSSRNRMKENDVPSEKKKTTSMPLVSEAGSSFSPCSVESNVLQSKPLLPEVAVDASLSNWLVSSHYNVSTTSIHCQ